MIGKSLLALGAALFVFTPGAPAMAQTESGIASFYNYHGRTTASGEPANRYGMTAAHRTLPFGSKVRVTNTRNGRSIVVRINDRGPFIRGRVIDVTSAGAKALGFSGLAPVKMSVVSRPAPRTATAPRRAMRTASASR